MFRALEKSGLTFTDKPVIKRDSDLQIFSFFQLAENCREKS